MNRNLGPESARTKFAELLTEHLASGTRPATATGEPWTDAEFAGEVLSTRDQADYASPRSVSNWRKGKSLPAEIAPILRALFGPTDRHLVAREALRKAFLAARSEKIGQAKRDPAGATWVARGDELAIDRSMLTSDERAAADPLRQQLQAAIRNMAAMLVDSAKRLTNSPIWRDLPATITKFHSILEYDPLTMPERLGEAYALLRG